MAPRFILPPFEAFRPAAPDSVVYVADVIGSTEFVARHGSYRPITFLATAALVVAANLSRQLPLLFTGDGAVVVADPAHDRAVGRALTALVGWAEASLGLGLRLARFPLSVLTAPLLIASQGRQASTQWHFLGGALGEADRRARDADAAYRDPEAPEEPDLSGLSCRWNPLPSRRGMLLSLLVEPRVTGPVERHRLLTRLCAEIAAIAPPVEALWPAGPDNLRFTWPPPGLALEVAARAPHPGWQRRLVRLRVLAEAAVEHAYVNWLGGHGTLTGTLAANTTAVQLADGLAMMIDCSPEHRTLIEAHLAALHDQGALFYGLHGSDQANVACFVNTLDDHFHHLDLNVGGYWQASRQLKAQRRAAAA